VKRLDDYMVYPRLSLLQDPGIQAQVLVRCCGHCVRTGQERRNASSSRPLRGGRMQLFAAVGDLRRWAGRA